MTGAARVGTLGGMTPLDPGVLGALAASLALLTAPLTGISTGPSAGTSGDWPISPPVVVTPFDDPLPYGAGHRGVDLAATPGQTVIAALPGRVTVAGFVAGRPLVVIAHENDLRTTYLPVQASVSVGDQVKGGEAIGVVAATGLPGASGPSSSGKQHCLAAPCLHWGARRGEAYIDPQSLVNSAPSFTGPIVLLPEP